MTKQEFLQLKVGDKVKTVSSVDTINDVVGGGDKYCDKDFTITKTDFGNNKVYGTFDFMPDSNAVYLYDYCLEHLHKSKGKSSKPTVFGRKAIETIFNDGGNNKIREEITKRAHVARSAIQSALTSTPKCLFKEQMAIADENIRQMKLLYRAIKK